MKSLQLLPVLGTKDYPLRPSKLDRLVRCTMSAALDDGLDSSGFAADVGSVCHAAIAAYHLCPSAAERELVALAAVEPALLKFPLANNEKGRNEVRLFLTPYFADPRNQNAKVIACELPVSIVLDPHPTDRTKQPIHINGTLDSIRDEIDGQWIVDYKSGEPQGYELVHDHFYQLLAYTEGARQLKRFPRLTGAKIMRLRGYRSRNAVLPSPSNVFFTMPWRISHMKTLLQKVTFAVAQLRNGEAEFGPSNLCDFCPQGGVFGCIPKADSLFGLSS